MRAGASARTRHGRDRALLPTASTTREAAGRSTLAGGRCGRGRRRATGTARCRARGQGRLAAGDAATSADREPRPALKRPPATRQCTRRCVVAGAVWRPARNPSPAAQTTAETRKDTPHAVGRPPLRERAGWRRPAAAAPASAHGAGAGPGSDQGVGTVLDGAVPPGRWEVDRMVWHGATGGWGAYGGTGGGADPSPGTEPTEPERGKGVGHGVSFITRSEALRWGRGERPGGLARPRRRRRCSTLKPRAIAIVARFNETPQPPNRPMSNVRATPRATPDEPAEQRERHAPRRGTGRGCPGRARRWPCGCRSRGSARGPTPA